jgi:hypothetical protein
VTATELFVNFRDRGIHTAVAPAARVGRIVSGNWKSAKTSEHPLRHGRPSKVTAPAALEVVAPPTDHALWPRGIEKLVGKGFALDESCQRGEPVDRRRAAEIAYALSAHVDSLPEAPQARVAMALGQRFASEGT